MLLSSVSKKQMQASLSRWKFWINNFTVGLPANFCYNSTSGPKSIQNSWTETEETFATRREAPKNNEERTKLERSSAIALHVLEAEHHEDFDNPEILSKYWLIYRDRINAKQLPAGGLHTKRQNYWSSMELNLSFIRNIIQILKQHSLAIEFFLRKIE